MENYFEKLEKLRKEMETKDARIKKIVKEMVDSEKEPIKLEIKWMEEHFITPFHLKTIVTGLEKAYNEGKNNHEIEFIRFKTIGDLQNIQKFARAMKPCLKADYDFIFLESTMYDILKNTKEMGYFAGKLDEQNEINKKLSELLGRLSKISREHTGLGIAITEIRLLKDELKVK